MTAAHSPRTDPMCVYVGPAATFAIAGDKLHPGRDRVRQSAIPKGKRHLFKPIAARDREAARGCRAPI